MRRNCWLLLTPANSNTNQNSYANSDRECGKRPGFGLSCNPTQSLIAGPGTDLGCLFPEAGRLVDRCALTTAEAIYDVVQVGQKASAIWLPAADALADAFRPALLPIPPSSFSMARK